MQISILNYIQVKANGTKIYINGEKYAPKLQMYKVKQHTYYNLMYKINDKSQMTHCFKV